MKRAFAVVVAALITTDAASAQSYPADPEPGVWKIEVANATSISLL